MRILLLLAVVALCMPPRPSESIDTPMWRPSCKNGKCGKR